MNVYRSFGNLMEAWVAEQRPSPEPEYLDNIPEDLTIKSLSDSSFLEKAVRAESLDSGVETASTDTSCHTLFEMDLLESTDSYKTPSSFASASLPSSPPPVFPLALRSNRDVGSSVFNTRLKQALQRSESRRQSECPAADQHFCLPKPHRISVTRSESFISRKTPPSGPAWQQTLSLGSVRKQGLGTVMSTGRSPGFIYLEHVCQTLEDTAKMQLYSQSYQMDMDVLPEHQDEMLSSQAFSACQQGNKSFDKDPSFHRDDQKQIFKEDKQFNEYPYGHFWQRSASETSLSSLHLSKFNLGTRGQQQSTRDLLAKEKDNKQVDMHKTNTKNWKIKAVSLKRDSTVKDSHTTEPSDKSSTRRQLSQLLRRRSDRVLTWKAN